MRPRWSQMQAFLNYIRTQKVGTGANAFIVDAALADWAAADTTTSGRITGTWAYHQIADRMSRIVAVIGRDADAREYRSLATSIRQAPGSAGYRQLVIDPRIVGDLTEVEGHYQTPRGAVSLAWIRKDGTFRMKLEVPSNTTAEVRVPRGGDAARVTADDARLDHVEGDRAVYSIGAGSYVFTAPDAHAGS